VAASTASTSTAASIRGTASWGIRLRVRLIPGTRYEGIPAVDGQTGDSWANKAMQDPHHRFENLALRVSGRPGRFAGPPIIGMQTEPLAPGPGEHVVVPTEPETCRL
jgi:hypothetical protein